MALKRKIAHINLDQGEVSIESIPLDWRRRFLGGRGMSSYLLYRSMIPSCDALSPENVIVISAGLLAGTPFSGSAHVGFAYKSPLTKCVDYSTLDGPFATELRWAGFDYLILQGRSKKPINLFIHNQKIEILEAGNLWGKKMAQAFKHLRIEQKGRESRILCIGPAGENKVRYANITDDRGTTTGRTGLGAVFGSKQIKAVLCCGTLDIEIKYPESALEWKKRSPHESPLKKWDIDTEKTEDADGGVREQAREYGMEFDTVQAMLSWVVRLSRESGVALKEAKALESGDLNAMAYKAMVEKIAFRRGFGGVLADGPLKALEVLGRGSLKYFGTIEKLLKIFKDEPPDLLTVKDQQKTDDGPVKRILNSLGLSYSVKRKAGEEYNLSVLKEMIRLNTGLIFKEGELKEIDYRSRVVERLLSIRENPIRKGSDLSNLCIELPEDAVIPESIFHGIDLKKYQMKIDEYYRENRWDKKSLLKLKVLKKLEISDLWHLR